MITLYFGNPGCGKTTLACKLARKARKRYDHVYTAFDSRISGVASCSLVGLGDWRFPRNSLILCDEAGIDFNSRAYQAMSQKQIKYFKKHRHVRNDWVVMSQSWDDYDVTLRRLTVDMWYLYRIGPWTLSRRVYKRIATNKETGEFIDCYKMASMLWLLFWPFQLGWPFQPKFKLTFRPFYYRYFDSFEFDSSIPERHFKIYEKETFLCPKISKVLANAAVGFVLFIQNLLQKIGFKF